MRIFTWGIKLFKLCYFYFILFDFADNVACVADGLNRR